MAAYETAGYKIVSERAKEQKERAWVCGECLYL